MMGYNMNEMASAGAGHAHMMGGMWPLVGGLIGLIVFIDLVLLGVWLWQHISKK